MPFCRSKCGYCDFNSFSGLDGLIPDYVEAVQAEVRLRCGGGRRRVHTIYFGGGTPSLLAASQIASIVAACRSNFAVDTSAEVSLETNPGSVTVEWLRAVRRVGVNRLSIGFQSLDDTELSFLGRTHTASQAVEAYEMAREAGGENLNIDLIYGLPAQSLGQWQQTLQRSLELSPEHFSLYPLTLEADTPLGQSVDRGEVPPPDPDAAADMYQCAERMLAEAGYEHYEISNWARPGRECQHNLTYWRNLPYIGLGPGAHSFVDGYRLANVADPLEYISRTKRGASPEEKREKIGPDLELSETVILGLRLCRGVDVDVLGKRFGLDVAALYRSEIDETVGLGLVELDGPALRLTRRGRLLGNEVFWRFLPKTKAGAPLSPP